VFEIDGAVETVRLVEIAPGGSLEEIADRTLARFTLDLA
jgi:acyl CoA:acetate/3-ketoacid CoA transferase beta subunit